MVSKDFTGGPILILGLKDVKILVKVLDNLEISDQDEVVKKLVKFINDPECIDWEQNHV